MLYGKLFFRGSSRQKTVLHIFVTTHFRFVNISMGRTARRRKQLPSASEELYMFSFKFTKKKAAIKWQPEINGD